VSVLILLFRLTFKHFPVSFKQAAKGCSKLLNVTCGGFADYFIKGGSLLGQEPFQADTNLP